MKTTTEDMLARVAEEVCIEDECGNPIHLESEYWCTFHHFQWKYKGTNQEPKDPVPPDVALKKYRISRAEYRAMLEYQEGCCAICKNPPKQRRLAIDHDHACCPGNGSCSRCIRGLLCPGCNTLLGQFEAGKLPGLVKYIEDYRTGKTAGRAMLAGRVSTPYPEQGAGG